MTVPRAATARAGWPLSRTLPLLITGLLAVVLAAVLLVTYTTMTATAVSTATARLERAADQLMRLAGNSTGNLRERVQTAAQDSTLRRTLVAAPGADVAPDAASDAARDATAGAAAVLGRLLSRTDTGLTAELWAADGRRVAFAGRDVRARTPSQPSAAEPLDHFVLPPGLDSLPASDSARIGALYLVGDVPHFWVVAPVQAAGQRLGYVARLYRIADGPRAEETIRGLTGADVASAYRNADGSVWTTLAGAPRTAPARRDSANGALRFQRPGTGALLAVERAIPGSPLVLALELPVHDVLAPARAAMRQLGLLSLIVLLAGAALAWALSRRLTGPLAALTGAAHTIAQGDYTARVEPAGAEELTRLAGSFNHMADEVGNAREELEMQAEEAQAMAEELEAANEDLALALQRLEERDAQFHTLADTIPQLAWMAHADGSVFWFNERWRAYTGTPPATSEGWGWQAAHHPAVLPEVVDQWRSALASGTPFEMEFPLRRADGAYRWFLTRALPVRDAQGQVVRWFGTSTDVQELRDAREAAERARAQAEDAREQAESASRAKSEFLAVMSHELRTPLNAIGGYTELLAMELRGPLTESQRRDLERIRASQQHLLGLVSAVLDLSRIEARRVVYDIVPVELDSFLASLESLVAPQAAAKQIALVHLGASAGLGVHADREKLRQILLNLLSNAIRHTPAGGRIELSAVVQVHDDRSTAISVADTGVGITEDALETIFEPFVQLDRSLTQLREGVGLGLAISRDLARGMGGDIHVRSRPGEGSCFTVVLPRATVDAADAVSLTSDEFRAVSRDDVARAE